MLQLQVWASPNTRLERQTSSNKQTRRVRSECQLGDLHLVSSCPVPPTPPNNLARRAPGLARRAVAALYTTDAAAATIALTLMHNYQYLCFYTHTSLSTEIILKSERKCQLLVDAAKVIANSVTNMGWVFYSYVLQERETIKDGAKPCFFQDCGTSMLETRNNATAAANSANSCMFTLRLGFLCAIRP